MRPHYMTGAKHGLSLPQAHALAYHNTPACIRAMGHDGTYNCYMLDTSPLFESQDEFIMLPNDTLIRERVVDAL